MEYKSKYDKACEILNIQVENENEITEVKLTKHYRKMSLLYHPDKNKELDSTEKFREIFNSYEYLGKYLGYIDDDDYSDFDDEEYQNVTTIPWNIISYTRNLIGIDFINQLKDQLLEKCFNEEKYLIKLHKFLVKNKDKMNVSDKFLNSLSYLIVELNKDNNNNNNCYN